MSANAQTQVKKRVKTRSPNFPSIDLATAIDRARVLYEHERRHPAAYDVVVGHWGLTPKSSSAIQGLAALSAFGLVATEGKGRSKQIRLSGRGLAIVEDERERSEDRDRAIQEAALAPGIHRELWEKYRGSWPSDENLRHFLLREKNFNSGSIGPFIRQFKATISFANLTEGAIMPDEEPDGQAADGDQRPRIGPSREPELPKVNPGAQQATFPLDEGQAVIQWPESISQQSFEDFEGWIKLILGRVKRSVGKATTDATSDNDAESG